MDIGHRTKYGDAECVLKLNMQKCGHRTLLFSGDEGPTDRRKLNKKVFTRGLIVKTKNIF